MCNANSSRLFQFYMDSFFKFPKDIRNDMIYCQRVLRDHIKVHQMVLDVFEQQPNQDPAHRNRILDEIESEIYEINAEQQFLFLRLRRVIDEFYKMLKKNNIPVEPNTTNNLISREVVPFIKNSTMKVNPVAVQARLDEDMLIQKYFEVQDDSKITTNENGCEVIDLCDNDDLEIIEVPPVAPPVVVSTPKTQRMRKTPLVAMSLLKPMEQRVISNNKSAAPNATKNANVFDKPNVHDVEIVPVSNTEVVATKNQEIEASKSVKMSRMNLRQALKRAHNVVTNSTTASEIKPKEKLLKSPTAIVNDTDNATTSPPPSKRQMQQQHIDAKPRTTRATTQAAAAQTALTCDTKSIELVNTSSDDSNLERDPTSPHPYWPDEMLETRTAPNEYGQEMFLRLFGLFTPEMLVHMQQRRSKRRRRTVQSNERSDYHYGRLEYANFQTTKDQKKERKFLLSPQAKAKKPKRSNGDKPDAEAGAAVGAAGMPVAVSGSPSPSSRSASSSPNGKNNCIECQKSEGALDSCSECKAFFHQSCHREDVYVHQLDDDVKLIEPKTEIELQCPPCKLKHGQMLKKEKIQNKTLHDTAKDLEKKMALQRDRRAKLQNASKLYKLQMLNLLNIVKKIQTDQDNDSSE